MLKVNAVDPSLEKELNQALHFAAKKLDESGHNPKPILFHSSKVSMTLYFLEYDREIVLAGALHDLLEDTDTTKDEIEEIYGRKIADIVEAVSFDPDIEDYMQRTREMFERCLECGKDALIVKCSDLLDNINFVHLTEPAKQTELLEKYRLFIKMGKDCIGDEEIYKRLVQRYDIALHQSNSEIRP